MIKLEALRVFVTVADAGNIKDAADRMCRTASAISMALKQLEQDIGGALFETDRKDSLTALGTYVFETGQVQLQTFDQAVGKIRAFAENRIGRLALASVPSVASNMVPTLLPDFVANRLGVEVQLFDLDSRNVRLFVETGQADIGIAGKPRTINLVTFQPLFRDRFKLICSSSNPLTLITDPLDWSDIEGETLIANGASEKIESLDYRKLSEAAAYSVPNVTSLIALARAGLGVTLLPALSTIDLPADVVALDLADDDVERTVGLLTSKRSRPNPVTVAFQDYLIDQMPALANDLGLRLALD
jgi:DNA-binding transcriptional LysR family regulator